MNGFGILDWQDGTLPQYQYGAEDPLAELGGSQGGSQGGILSGAAPGSMGQPGSLMSVLGAAMIDASMAMRGRPATQMQTLRDNQDRRDLLSIKAREQDRRDREQEYEIQQQEAIKDIFAGLPGAGGARSARMESDPFNAQLPGSAVGNVPNGMVYPAGSDVPDMGQVPAGMQQYLGDDVTTQGVPQRPAPQMLPYDMTPPGIGGTPEQLASLEQRMPGGIPLDMSPAPQAGMAPFAGGQIMQRKQQASDAYRAAAVKAMAAGQPQIGNQLLQQAKQALEVTPTEFAQMTPSARQNLEAFYAAKRPGSTTTVNNFPLGTQDPRMPDQLTTENIKSDAGIYRGEAAQGRRMIPGSKNLKEMVFAGVPQGKWASVVADVAPWLGGEAFTQALGFEPGQLSQMRVFDAQTGPMIMSWIAQTKGAITEKEMDLFKSWSPQLGNQPEANYVMAALMERAGTRMSGKPYAQVHYLRNVDPSGEGFENWFANNEDAKQWNPWAGETKTDLRAIADEYEYEMARRGHITDDEVDRLRQQGYVQ